MNTTFTVKDIVGAVSKYSTLVHAIFVQDKRTGTFTSTEYTIRNIGVVDIENQLYGGSWYTLEHNDIVVGRAFKGELGEGGRFFHSGTVLKDTRWITGGTFMLVVRK
tara:strand:- start:2035 stop:2355 length:321 start_codon:yes stop_codon:yes gene_type:complete